MEADFEDLVTRIETVERAITDGDRDLSGVAASAARADRLAELEETLTDIDERVTELEATVQSLRGYLGGVRAVNEDVERRANAALAKAESLEADRDGDACLRAERVRATDARRPERVTPTDAARRAMNGTDTSPATEGAGGRAVRDGEVTERASEGGRDPERATDESDRTGLADRLRAVL